MLNPTPAPTPPPSLESRYRGVMLGLAVGDALGAPVEFDSRESILAARGPQGVTDLEPWGRHPAGAVTDDTQMSIATAEGILDAIRWRRFDSLVATTDSVYRAYLLWNDRQSDPDYRRAPGNTCLSALASGRMGTPFKPLNDSKGCGTIMRIAPCALLVPDGSDAFDLAAWCGAITHGHALGWGAGAAFAAVLERVLAGDSLIAAVEHAAQVCRGMEGDDFAYLAAILDDALCMDADGIPLETRIAAVGNGEGWVAEETLNIALACALAHPSDWSAAVLSAVNITGDSDSTGSVTGALMGALLGEDAIPEAWRMQVEHSAELGRLSDELLDERLRRECDPYEEWVRPMGLSGRDLPAPSRPGRPTHADDWKAEPMGEAREQLDYHEIFSAAEMRRIACGLMPYEMEDKWFVYFAEGWLHFHRSWTGFETYQARFEPCEDGFRVDEAWVTRDTEQYTGTDAEEDLRNLRFMLEGWLAERRVERDHGEGLDDVLRAWANFGQGM